LFATGQYGIPTPDGVDTSTTVEGPFWGGGLGQFKAQAIGSLTCLVVVGGAAFLLMWLVNLTGTLRVPRDGELEGLDLHERGTPAYHMEFGQGVTYTTMLGTGSVVGNGGPSLSKAPVAAGETDVR
jgi:Amt family ammonium transporter